MKLTDKSILWIIRQKEAGNMNNRDIATIQHISVVRVKQLWSKYRRTGIIPKLVNPGRPTKGKPSYLDEQTIVNAYIKHRCGAVYLEHMLRSEGFKIPHNTIHKVLVKNGLSSIQRSKRGQRKYVKYERRHGMSMRHTDFYEIEDPRWRGKQLIAYEEDSSRFIVGYAVLDSATGDSAIRLLDQCIARYGKPREVLTDHGPQFCPNPGEGRADGKTLFQLHLEALGIVHIPGRIHHLETNGKIERFYETFQQKIRLFDTVEEFM